MKGGKMGRIEIKEWCDNYSENTEPFKIKDILPDDAGEYIMISGKTGIGKSIVALHLGFCLANGYPFYGYKTAKQEVSYIAMEGGRGNWKDRIKKVAPQYKSSSNLFFDLIEPHDLLKENRRKLLLEKCRGSKVVIFDNLRQVTAGQYLSPEYAAEWIKVYQAFLKELGAVGVVTHHIKKKDNRYLVDPDDVYQLKGATEYVDVATTVLLIERQKQRASENGRYSKSDPNRLAIYFAKTRIATEILHPIKVVRNYERCSLEVEAIDNDQEESSSPDTQ